MCSMPSNVLLGCLKKNVMNSNPSSSSQSSCQGTQFVQVDKNLFQSLSIYIYIHICQRTRGKSVIDGLEQGIKKMTGARNYSKGVKRNRDWQIN